MDMVDSAVLDVGREEQKTCEVVAASPCMAGLGSCRIVFQKGDVDTTYTYATLIDRDLRVQHVFGERWLLRSDFGSMCYRQCALDH